MTSSTLCLITISLLPSRSPWWISNRRTGKTCHLLVICRQTSNPVAGGL
ncbi:hypothetical protein TIFTF001_020714, partial [Ficus carica]